MALALGGCTVAELQERMAYSEFVEWAAFYDTEPFGETRADLQAATLAATIVNVNRGKRGKVFKPSDFLIDWWRDQSKPRALMAKFKAITAKLNGTGTRNTSSRASR